MEKAILATAITITLGSINLSAQAALTPGTLLAFDPGGGERQCRYGLGTYPDNCLYKGSVENIIGSWFAMDSNGNGPQDSEKVPLIPGPDGGVIIGQSQLASGSHGGFPGCDPLVDHDPPNNKFCTGAGGPGEMPGVDLPWAFFGNTGMDFITNPVAVIDDDVNGDGGFTKTLDWTGWTVTWNGIAAIPIGGIATITCSTPSCSVSSTFVLDYATIIPPSTLHGFGGVPYFLHLVGHVSQIPVPTAVWLFGAGLIGLASTTRRKHN